MRVAHKMSLHEVVDLSSLLTSENLQQSQKESLLLELETAISKQEIRVSGTGVQTGQAPPLVLISQVGTGISRYLLSKGPD